MTPLTPFNAKKLRRDLAFIHLLYANVKMKFSFKKLKTYREVLLALGMSLGEVEYAYSKEQLDSLVSIKDIQTWESRDKLNKEREYEQRNWTQPALIEHEYENVTFLPNTDDIQSREPSTDARQEEKKEEKEVDIYPPFNLPNQKAKLFKFQNKAAWQIVDKIIDRQTLSLRKRAVLLRAGVGVGKTFILGQVLAYLESIKLRQKLGIVSPWPIAWITRASIVEQTKRVCRDQFGLDTYATLQVINIEQLRAKFGDWMLSWETKVEGGEEHIICKWKSKIHPFIIVIDECQLAKNENSIQTKIIAALSEIPFDEPVIIICSSATPFTRVLEAAYFVKNTWKTI